MEHPHPIRLTGLCKDDSITLSEADLSGVDVSALNPVLLLIHTTRQQLLTHQEYREAYVQRIRELYKAGTPAQQRYLYKAKPTRPSDTDIHMFVLLHWPEVRLKRKPDSIPGCVSDVHVVRPLESAIHVQHDLAIRLIEEVKEILPHLLYY